MKRERRIFATAVAGACLWPALPAFAHAYLVKSFPARHAELLKSPASVDLWFNERLEQRFCSITVYTTSGKAVVTGPVVVGADPKRISVKLPALEPGAYAVAFRVVSVDSHVVESQFGFTVRSARKSKGG